VSACRHVGWTEGILAKAKDSVKERGRETASDELINDKAENGVFYFDSSQWLIGLRR
jgi:hypothetical protein